MTFHKYLGDSKMFEYDKHYKECRQLNKPFIKARVNPENEKYFVQVDLITCDYNLSRQEQDEIKKLLEQKMELLESVSNSNLDAFCIDKEVSWFNGVPPKNVHEFCENLYDLIQRHH